MTSRDQEREDLEALRAHPGWSRFLEHVEAEWGPRAYAARLERAIAATPAGPEAERQAHETVFQITAARREIFRLIAWVEERLDRLRHAPSA